MTGDPDVPLIRQYLTRQDDASFKALVNRYKDLVFNFAFRFLGNGDDAADCSQEIFIKVYRGLQNFRFESKFSSWLYRIMVNCCKDAARKNQVRKRMFPVTDTRISMEEDKHKLPEKTKVMNPERELEKKEMEDLFSLALSRLKLPHRTAIILRDVEGRSYEEISQITGMKPGTVRSTLARARYQMAEMLIHYRHEMQEI